MNEIIFRRKRVMNKQNIKKKEEISNDTAQEAGIRLILQVCKSTQLKKMLLKKKVLYRSKLTTKKKMIDVLIPLMNQTELDELNQEFRLVNTKKSNKCFVNEKFKQNQDNSEFQYPKEGHRYNGTIMGVDVHKNTLVCAIVDSHGVINEQTFENSNSGISSILQIIKAHKCEAVAMESTGEYWLNFAWNLQDERIPILVANPQQTKATQGIKTDIYDARRIAFAFRDGRLKPSLVCTRNQFALRKIGRDMLAYIQQETFHKNRLNKILIQCENGTKVYDLIKNERGIKILHGLCSCSSLNELIPIVQEGYSRKKGKITKYLDIKSKAEEFWSVRLQIEKNQSFIRFLAEFESYCQIKERCAYFELEMMKMISKCERTLHSLRLLMTIPSVGLKTALILIAEIVDIRFFTSSKKLVKWCGLAPRVNQSGYHKRNNGRLCKSGNKYIRRAAYLAVQADYNVGKHGVHPVGLFARKIYEKTNIYKHAMVAGSHKLLSIVYGILTTQKQFSVESTCQDEISNFERSTSRKISNFNRFLIKSVTTNTQIEFNNIIKNNVDQIITTSNDLRILLKKLKLPNKLLLEV